MKKIIFFLITYLVLGVIATGGWFYLNNQVVAETKKADELQKTVNQKQSERDDLAREVNGNSGGSL